MSAVSMVMTLFVIATTIVIITGVGGGIWAAAAFAAIGLAVGGYFGLRGIRAGPPRSAERRRGVGLVQRDRDLIVPFDGSLRTSCMTVCSADD